MKLRNLLIIIVCVLCFTTKAQTISDASFGKGLINFVAKDSTFSMKFAPRIQARFNSQWDYDGDSYGDAAQNFSLRRARLKFSGFNIKWSLASQIEMYLGLVNLIATHLVLY